VSTGEFAQVGFARTAESAGTSGGSATWANEAVVGLNAGYWGIQAVFE
jgi:hypothetical protein